MTDSPSDDIEHQPDGPVRPSARRLRRRLAIALLLIVGVFVLMMLAVGPPSYAGIVNVRWVEGVSEDQRARLEQRYGLELLEMRERNTGVYKIHNASSANIEAIVKDPSVDDTHGIDRRDFRLGRRERIRTWLNHYLAALGADFRLG